MGSVPYFSSRTAKCKAGYCTTQRATAIKRSALETQLRRSVLLSRACHRSPSTSVRRNDPGALRRGIRASRGCISGKPGKPLQHKIGVMLGRGQERSQALGVAAGEHETRRVAGSLLELAHEPLSQRDRRL